MTIERTLFEIRIKESDKGREYWLDRPWLSVRRTEVQKADILVVPWENFRDNEPALFPQGAADFVQQLTQRSSSSVTIAIDEDQYNEILLHSRMHRLPTMLVRIVLLPALAGMLGNLMADLVKRDSDHDQVAIKLIVEGENGRCISLEYEGPSERLADTVLMEINRCFPQIDQVPVENPTPLVDRTTT